MVDIKIFPRILLLFKLPILRLPNKAGTNRRPKIPDKNPANQSFISIILIIFHF